MQSPDCSWCVDELCAWECCSESADFIWGGVFFVVVIWVVLVFVFVFYFNSRSPSLPHSFSLSVYLKEVKMLPGRFSFRSL